MVGLSVLQEDLKKSSTPHFSKRTELNKVKRLSWSGAKPLMLFSQKLKESSYISDPKTFELLFKDSDEDYLVEINKNKARHFSYMINRLNNSEPRVISPVGGRGYFSFIEGRIVYDSSGRFSKDYMKKTAYHIKQEKERNTDLIKEVEDLIEEFIPNKRTIDGR